MKPFDLNEKNLFLDGWFIDQSLCEDLIQNYIDLISQKKEMPIKSEGMGYYSVCFSDLDNDLKTRYFDQIYSAVDLYKQKNIWCDKGQNIWNIACLPNIQRYEPGKFYQHWHAENCGSAHSWHRHLVFMTFLNSVSQGGETEFYYQQVKIKPQKGLTLIWPAGWTHTHKGNPAPCEEKFIITGWFSYNFYSWSPHK